jgi:hypothetical protein
MGGACSKHGEDEKYIFQSGNLGVDGKIIL